MLQKHKHHLICGSVAQLVEQRTENPCVAGSIPARATTTTVYFLPISNQSLHFYKISQCLGGKHVPDYEIKFAFWHDYRRKCGAFNEGNVQGPLQTKA